MAIAPNGYRTNCYRTKRLPYQPLSYQWMSVFVAIVPMAVVPMDVPLCGYRTNGYCVNCGYLAKGFDSKSHVLPDSLLPYPHFYPTPHHHYWHVHLIPTVQRSVLPPPPPPPPLFLAAMSRRRRMARHRLGEATQPQPWCTFAKFIPCYNLLQHAVRQQSQPTYNQDATTECPAYVVIYVVMLLDIPTFASWSYLGSVGCLGAPVVRWQPRQQRTWIQTQVSSRDFFQGELYQWLYALHSRGFPGRRLAITGQRWDLLARCQYNVTAW